MSQKYNYNQNRNYGYNQNRQDEVKPIEQPLHIYYADKSKLFLEDGVAFKKADQFKRSNIATHQLRKILNQTKKCVEELENKNTKFEDVRNELFSLLPLSAYNAGRDKNLKSLYVFLKEHLNLKSIVEENDIKVFDELFTSIVAYHKFLGGK